MKHRSRGRELALKYLFSCDANGRYSLDDFAPFAADQEDDRRAREFALEISEGVINNLEVLRAKVTSASRTVPWHRMALIDRNLLLLGAFELLHQPETPPEVILNEVVELGKSYGSAATGAFVNALLDGLRREPTVADQEVKPE